MLGDTIDDKTASAILAPFKNDYDQLSIFKSILLKTVQDSNELDTRFEETFRAFNACQNVLNACAEMSELAKSLFLHRKYDDVNEAVVFYGEQFCSQYEGYDEMADQQRIAELAVELKI